MSNNQEPSPSSSTSTPVSKGNKGRPKGSAGESLIKRSKEVLGLDRVKDIQRRKKSTKDEQDGGSKAAIRREQVLEAQRTHRMRTKIYIKELESEVLRLREAEAVARDRAETLTLTLQAHGIQPPAETSDLPWQSGFSEDTPMGNVATVSDRSRDLSANASTSALAPAQPQLHNPSPQLLPETGSFSVVPSLFPSPERSPGQQINTKVDPNQPFHFGNSQAELDFILTLERPCMNHFHESHFGPLPHPFNPHTFLEPSAQPANLPEDDPEALFSGHVLTASMPLWQRKREGGPTNPFPETTRKELDTLLQSSFQLGLRNEIAPIQILQLLRTRNDEMRQKVMTVQDLRRLADELSKHLKCYGFGAVFDEDIVRSLVREVSNERDF